MYDRIAENNNEVELMSITYEGLVRLLENSVCDIKFTKADGTERDMTCTLNRIDESVGEIAEGHNNSSNNRITVWDLDKKDWRSFRKDSLLRCSVTTSIMEVASGA